MANCQLGGSSVRRVITSKLSLRRDIAGKMPVKRVITGKLLVRRVKLATCQLGRS